MKKHIICFGDSNTHGYCADPNDCVDHGVRFNEDERWTCLLQRRLGDEYLVIEEGLSGRTTVFDDPLHEGLSGLDVISPVLKTHDPVDLLIIMLGTNDTKERFGVGPSGIGLGMERLVRKAQSELRYIEGQRKVLVVAPPAIGEGILRTDFAMDMGTACVEKSRGLAKVFRTVAENNVCAFFDANGVAEFNSNIDYMHLTKKGHEQLAEALSEIVKQLI